MTVNPAFHIAKDGSELAVLPKFCNSSLGYAHPIMLFEGAWAYYAAVRMYLCLPDMLARCALKACSLDVPN